MKGKHIRLTADYIKVNDVIEEYNDDPLRELKETFKGLADAVFEARNKALKEGIKANTVIIDEHFAKVNAFDFVFGRDVMHLPPMICGLEVQVSDELPDGYDFAVLEVPETERERLIRKAKSEVAREIFEEIDRMCVDTFGNFNHRVFEELKKKYTEGQK